MDNDIELFKQFPVVEDQFDLIAIDCIKLIDEDHEFYTPLIRYMVRDHTERKVIAGMTIRTGSTCESLEDVAEFMSHLSNIGVFLSDVSAFGTIYDEDMGEIEDVNWNAVRQLTDESLDDRHFTNKTTNYLH